MAKWFSYVYINISVLFQIIFPYRLLQNIGYGSLCYVVGPCLVMGSRSLLQGMFTSSRDLCNPGIEPGSPALQVDSLPSEPPGKSYIRDFSEWRVFAEERRDTSLSAFGLITDTSKWLFPFQKVRVSILLGGSHASPAVWGKASGGTAALRSVHGIGLGNLCRLYCVYENASRVVLRMGDRTCQN